MALLIIRVCGAGEYWRLYADGTVLWSITTVKRITCFLNFEQLPWDTQQCTLRAYLYRGNQLTEELVFNGGAETAVLGPGSGRVIGGSQEWALLGCRGEVFNHTAVGEDDTALDIIIVFKRDSMYYIFYVVFRTTHGALSPTQCTFH